ncbi:MAG: hypothetical protein HC806_10220 [Anaerolineae bacterium]|nr:hypothetical protein [Anaerolineae bacterium]
MDTQWPSYIVFDESKEGKPAFYAGAVHAPDPEMALQNARDVFGRRDDHVRLWVVRESHIYAKTAEELTLSPPEPTIENGDLEPYHVFQKTTHKGTLNLVGEIEAANPSDAMAKSIDTFPNLKAIVWWVIPTRVVYRTEHTETGILFTPGTEKAFRHPSHYPTVTLMREINLANEKLNWEDE